MEHWRPKCRTHGCSCRLVSHFYQRTDSTEICHETKRITVISVHCWTSQVIRGLKRSIHAQQSVSWSAHWTGMYIYLFMFMQAYVIGMHLSRPRSRTSSRNFNTSALTCSAMEWCTCVYEASWIMALSPLQRSVSSMPLSTWIGNNWCIYVKISLTNSYSVLCKHCHG